MVMLFVIPSEERASPLPRSVNREKAVGIIEVVFHGFEVRLTEGIIVRCVGAIMAFADAQIEQQLAEGFTAHGCTIIGMKVS